MVAEKLYSIITPIVALIAGGSLALFVDSRALVYVIIVGSILIASTLFGMRVLRKIPDDNHVLHYATITYIAWAAASALFGLRSLQITSLGIVIVGGILLSLFIGISWTQTTSFSNNLWRIVALLTLEWFFILLFAPGSYMVLGALFAVCVSALASLLTSTLSRDVIIRTTATTLIIALIFILSFKWVL